MKKIFKFFPVALAAIAMASCSSDDLTEGNYISQEDLDPTKLYVVLEDEGGVTRGGFSEGIVDGSLKRKLFFEKGDEMKVYHDQTNWRPQVWKYEGEANIAYEKNKGLVASTFKCEGEQYTSGYGVFPADLAKFTEEDRSKAQFDLKKLANVEWSAAASTIYNKEGQNGIDTYVAPMPLWGYSPDNVMKAHYLTSYLRIEASQLEAVAEGKAIYMVIQSADGESLNGKFDVTIDPEKLLEQEPELETTAGVRTNLVSDGVDAFANNENDVIVLKIGKREAGPFVAYVPIVAGVSGLKVYKTEPIDEATAAGTLLKTGGTEFLGDTPYAVIDASYIKERNKSDVGTTQRGVFYNIIKDDTKVVASSPYALAEIIKKMDAKMVRDFSITVDPATPTVVDRRNTDTPTKFELDLSDYALKNNVTVNVAFTSYQNSNADILEVKTKAGSKTLKLNLNTAGEKPLKVITFNKNTASPVELAGANLNAAGFVVNAGSKNLTIKSSANAVYATAETNIDALDGTTAGIFKGIFVKKGAEKINLTNGVAQNLTIDATVDHNVTIDGNGRAAIKTVTGLMTDAGKKNVIANGKTSDFNKVRFITSAWDGTAFGSEGNAQLVASSGKIYFAAQLQAVGKGTEKATSYTIMAESLDLNNKAWTPVNAENKQVTANYTGADLAKDQKQAEIKKVKISTSADNAGLFATAGAISNIDLENVNIETTADGKKNIGALVGVINGNISNVKVKNVTINATGLSENIGALAGTSGTAGVFNDIEIEGANLTGYTKMGGIIGYVQENLTIGVSKDKTPLIYTVPEAASFTKGDAVMNTTTDAEKVCSVKNVTFTQNTKPGTYQYIPAYAAIGDYVGSVVNANKTLHIFTEEAAATTPLFTRPANYTNFGKFTFSDTDGSTYVVEIGREQYLVGLSGFQVKVDPELTAEQPIVIFFNRTAEKKFDAHKFVSKVGTTGDKVDVEADNYLNYTGVKK